MHNINGTPAPYDGAGVIDCMMIGLLSWTAPVRGVRQRGVQVRERMILRSRFLEAEVLRGSHTPEAAMRRRVHAAAKKLEKRGVRQVVLPEDFPYRDHLEGLQPVSALPLRQALAADWVRWALIRQGTAAAGARVAVCADRLSGEVVRTVTELSLRHRYVLLDLPYGGEELCRQLRREYGVSVLLRPTREQLGEADAALLFAPRTAPAGSVLCVYDEASPLPPLALPPGLEEQLPAGVNREQLLSLLRESGLPVGL